MREPEQIKVDVGLFRPDLLKLMRAVKTFRVRCMKAKTRGDNLKEVPHGILPAKIANSIRRVAMISDDDMIEGTYDLIYPLPRGTWRAGLNGITFATGTPHRRAVALLLEHPQNGLDDTKVAYLSIQGDAWILTCRPRE